MSRRQFALDTETTGLEPERGHRLIEIALVELVDRRLTGRDHRWYLNPQREIDEGAFAVHGLSSEFLADKPLFADIAGEFLELIDGAELLIHNAAFDLGFLDAELRRWRASEPGVCARAEVVDTLKLARELHPGQRNGLDALCKRYDVDNSSRKLHGALLDAQLLAEVYLAMTSGQISLDFAQVSTQTEHASLPTRPVDLSRLRIWRAGPEELELHGQRLQKLDKLSRNQCLWRQLEAGAGEIGVN